MTQRNHFAFLVPLLLMTAGQYSFSQLQTTISISGLYDDNPFRNNLSNSDYYANSSLGLDYTPPESDFSFFVNGSAGMFKQFSDRRYFTSTLGAAYGSSFGEQNQNGVSAGASYFMRFNANAFNVYDLSQPIGYANLKYYFDYDNGFLGRVGYRLKYRGYKNLDEFSYMENFGILQLSQFFQTKTSLIVEFDVGNKNYISAPTLSSATSTGGTPHSGGMHGSGWMNWTNDGEMMGSYNWNYGDHAGRIVTYSTPNTTQLISIARVAQSLGATTGLSLQFLKRWNVTDRTRFLTSSGTDFQGDAELWDDSYGYEGDEYNTTLTQILPWDVSARLSTDYLVKDYSRHIFAANTTVPIGPFRNDTKAVVGIDLKKTFEDGPFSEITLNVSYVYQRNISNDPYYDYSNNIFAIGVTIQL